MLKPIEDRVVVKPIVEDISTTASGFLINKTDEKPQEAIVIAVGEGITLPSGAHVDLDVKVGDKVVFAKYSGTEVAHDGENYLVLPYRDILAVLEEN
jgi:chaperonin GroES